MKHIKKFAQIQENTSETGELKLYKYVGERLNPYETKKYGGQETYNKEIGVCIARSKKEAEEIFKKNKLNWENDFHINGEILEYQIELGTCTIEEIL